jgi:hypothetical protein
MLFRRPTDPVKQTLGTLSEFPIMCDPNVAEDKSRFAHSGG